MRAKKPQGTSPKPKTGATAMTQKVKQAKSATVVSPKTVELDPSGKKAVIYGTVNNDRVASRILEERIQQAIHDGARNLHVLANGHHGIGGRIWPLGETVKITVEGPVGQRAGSMGMTGTEIVIQGGASDDVGWVNCGAKITVLGDVTNGAFNAAAQGILYVQGSGAARCDTLTKHNPRFDPPQSWYFRNVGDSFAEFKAGGIAVVCGVNPRNPENILGYRPCVGMVGGVIYFRGKIQGYSEKDVKLLDLTPQDWEWLTVNLKPYLAAIDRQETLQIASVQSQGGFVEDDKLAGCSFSPVEIGMEIKWPNRDVGDRVPEISCPWVHAGHTLDAVGIEGLSDGLHNGAAGLPVRPLLVLHGVFHPVIDILAPEHRVLARIASQPPIFTERKRPVPVEPRTPTDIVFVLQPIEVIGNNRARAGIFF